MVGLIQSSEGLARLKHWPPPSKREICSKGPLNFSGSSWISRLLAHPANFGLANLYNHISQFLKINHIYVCICVRVCIYIYMKYIYMKCVCVHIYIYICVHISMYIGRGNPKHLELSSWGWAPCSTGFPRYVWLQRIFLKTLSMPLLISWRLIYKHTCPTLHWVFISFWPKTAGPLCPTLPIHLIFPQATFVCLFVSLDEKSPQRKCFAEVEEVKQNTAQTLKGLKSTSSKTVLNSGKNTSTGVYSIGSVSFDILANIAVFSAGGENRITA